MLRGTFAPSAPPRIHCAFNLESTMLGNENLRCARGQAGMLAATRNRAPLQPQASSGHR